MSISELITGVNIALEKSPVSACPSFDDDGDGRVGINELIRSVSRALTVCVFTGDGGGEASSGVVSGVADAYGRLRFGSLGSSGAGGGAAATGLAAAVEAVLSGQAAFCETGDVQTLCTSRGGSSLSTAEFDRCTRRLTDNLRLLIDGRVERQVDDAAFCSTLALKFGSSIVDTTVEFEQSLTNLGTGETSTTISNLVRSYVFRGDACEQRNGESSLDGTLLYRCEPGSEMPASCPAEGEDLLLRAEALQLITENRLVSFGDDTRCIEALTASGRLDSRDRVNERRFNGLFSEFHYERDPGTGVSDVRERVNGTVAVDCLGAIGVVTEIPLSRAAMSRCPLGGLVFVEGTGFFVGIDYADGGVSFDFGADGSPGRSFPNCEDPSIEFCS